MAYEDLSAHITSICASHPLPCFLACDAPVRSTAKGTRRGMDHLGLSSGTGSCWAVGGVRRGIKGLLAHAARHCVASKAQTLTPS